MLQNRQKILIVASLFKMTMQTCFHCRQTGHLVAECPVVQETDMGVGNCYRCGSSEHTTKHCTGKSTSDAGKYITE